MEAMNDGVNWRTEVGVYNTLVKDKICGDKSKTSTGLGGFEKLNTWENSQSQVADGNR
jgi:hypothetical protein